MRAIRNRRKVYSLRPLVALAILSILAGTMLTSLPAYANDGAAAAPAIEASAIETAAVEAPAVEAPADGAPSADTTPAVDATPEVDASAATADTFAPEADTTAPDADTSAPADASIPACDAEAPAQDITAPEVDAAAPADDVEATAIDDSVTMVDTQVADAPIVDAPTTNAEVASVSTGQSDYMPGSTVDIAGQGFAPNAEITVTLSKPDGSETQWMATADDAGTITTTYELTDGIEGAYFVWLSDGNNTAATLFTDPVIILLPNGNGAVTQLSDYPSAGSNWQKVADVTNDDTTYVYTTNTSASGKEDLYAIGNLTDTVKPNDPVLSSTSHTPGVWSNKPTVTMVWYGVSDPGSPSANSVTVTAICRTTATTPGGSASVGVKPLGGTESWATAGTLGTGYSQFSSEWTTNPTTGQPWTYSDINNLQAGVTLKSPSSSSQARSTTVWLEVDSDEALASGVSGYRYEWDDSTPDNVMANQGTGVQHTWTQTLTQGTRTFYVYTKDNAGNNSNTISSGPYKIDLTAPTLSTSRTPAANSYGWNKTNVTASYTSSDALSGLATPASGSYVFNTESASQSYSFTAIDNAGNTTTKAVTASIDWTKPTVSGSPSPGANSYGWNNTNVIVHFTGADALSGIATVTSDITISSQGANRSATGTATDKAGNSASTTVSGINIDKTNPTISTSRTPAANSYGWNNANVTASYTASDALSGLITPASGSYVFNTEGENQSHDFTATDKAANTALKTVTASIDKTKPTVSGSPSPGANSYGWNNTDVIVHFTGSDALSGIATVTPDITITSEGVNRSATGTATDKAGNNSLPTTVSDIDIDKTAPTVTGSPDRPAIYNGWYNGPVVISWAATDQVGLSGVNSTNPGTDLSNDTLSTNGAGQTATATAYDYADNMGTGTYAVKIDQSPPTVTGSPDQPANIHGWYNGPVTISWTATDSLSGVNYANPGNNLVPDTLSAEGSGQTATAKAYDYVNNTGTGTHTVNIDTQAPTVTGSPTTGPTGAHGWYNAPVDVLWNAQDNLSGFDAIGTLTKSWNSTINAQGTNMTDTQSATDWADNAGQVTSSGINTDWTAPNLVTDAARTGLNEITVTLTGADTASGVDFIRYSTDGGTSWTTVNSDTTTFTITGIGNHNLGHLVFDIAGNEYVLADQTLTIDSPGTGGGVTPGATAEAVGTVASLPIAPDGTLLADIELVSPDGAMTLQILAGTQTLNADGTPATDFQILPAEGVTAPDGYQMIAAYQLLSPGLTLSPDATLIISYDPATVPEGSTPVIAYFDETAGAWVEVDTAGYVAGTITAQISGAHIFAILARFSDANTFAILTR